MIADFLGVITASTGIGPVAMLLIKSTLVVSLGLVMWLALRRSTASARHLVLGATLIAILVLPVIASLGPALQLPVLNTPSNGVTATLFEAQPSNAKPAIPATIRKEMPRPFADSTGPANIYLTIYLFITSVVLAYLFLGVARVWWLSRTAIEVTHAPGWRRLLGQRDVGRTRVLIAEELSAPLTWGVIRPVVLLPDAAEKWSEQDKKNALLHELAHIERGDWLMQMIARMISAIYWFNPLVWITQRQLVLEAELAADDRVLRSGAAPDEYAEQLIALTKRSRVTRMPLAATTMAEKSMLSRRVHSIMNSGARKMTLNKISRSVLVSAVSMTALLIGSVQLVAAPQEDNADTLSGYSQDISTPLIRAAAGGNNAEVTRLLQAGANVNETPDNRGAHRNLPRSALTAAAKGGHLDVVKTLLEAGAPVNRIVRGDATALIAATRQDHFEVMAYLIEQGADANLAVQGDGSPLIAATAVNNPDAVRLLLQRGADADLSVRGDENPLYHAAANGNDEIMQMLIDAGVDINQEWRGDGTALIVATRQGNTSAAEALMLAGARSDQGVKGDGNAMIVAAQRGDTDLLQKMIATGADVNASVKGDGSPLIQAARNGHMQSVVLLLQAGADIDMVVSGDENALIGAAWNGDVEMVEHLLRSGANPSIKAQSYGQTRTALSQANLEGHDDIVRMLKAAGATE